MSIEAQPATSAAAPPRRRRLALPWTLVAGSAIVGFWLFVAIFAPLIAPYDPIAQDISSALKPAGAAHWLGTDNFGRDMLSRIIWGTRIDLMMGVFGVLFPFMIGITIGAVSGYVGGILDTLLMRLVDITIAFPFFVLIIAIVATLGPGLGSFYVALALVGWVSYARLIRAQFLVLKNADFVVAARGLGYSNARIVFRHILPNAIMPAVVFSMSDAVIDILLGASLSYLGLGIQPPTAEWGLMIADGQNFIASAWWIALFPGVAIVTLAIGFSFLADGFAEHFGVQE
jgi:peptide/nickel transport system permease protein